MKKFLIIYSIIVFLIVSIITYISFVFFVPKQPKQLVFFDKVIYENTEKNENDCKEIIFEQDETIRGAASILLDNEIIKQTYPLVILSKINNNQYVKKPGTYLFCNSMNSQKIFDILTEGKTEFDYQIPINSGSSVADIISEFSKNDNEFEAISREINDIYYIKELQQKFEFLPDEILNENIMYRLEGYLGTGTFLLKDEDTIKDLIEKSLTAFKEQLNSSIYSNELNNLTKTELFNLITLSSVVRGEVLEEDTENAKLVAGVFQNRIEQNMMLQSDVTVGYSLGITDKNYTIEQLENPSPYNTYYAYGLPIGPINNPGISLIESTLNKTDHEYLFFLADICNDGYGEFGKVYYSLTEEEHDIKRYEFLTCIY